MVLSPQAEFALGELALHEFGQDAGVNFLDFSFSSSGEAKTSFEGSRKFTASFTSAGTTQVDYKFSAIVSANFKSDESVGKLTFNGGNAVLAAFTSTGIGTFKPRPGKNEFSQFQSLGKSSTFFVPAGAEEFVAQGVAYVDFRGGSVETFIWESPFSSSTTDFHGVGVISGSLNTSGYSEGKFSLEVLSTASFSMFGSASSSFLGTKLSTGGFDIRCESSTQFKFKVFQDVKWISESKSAGSFEGYRWQTTEMKSDGVAVVAFNGVQRADYSWTSLGLSKSVWNPGSPVAAYLPPAKDMVIRPSENRGARWK